ncbi:MAG: hypothetical protein IT406_03840 [Candidatus Yanofskybacteria bacterium]|nr:hypothetical protein [Candidatus Yanofskybacteria bacterium]
MGNRQLAHSLFRWSLAWGFVIGLYWWVWTWFAPLPPYRMPDMKTVLGPRIIWYDILLVIVLVNLAGWLLRFVQNNDGPAVVAMVSGLLGFSFGMVFGDMFGPTIWWLFGASFGAFIGGSIGLLLWSACLELGYFAWRNTKALARIPVGLVTGGVPLAWRNTREFFNVADVSCSE